MRFRSKSGYANSLSSFGIFAATVILGLSSSISASAYTEKTLYTFCSIGKCADGAKPFDIAMDTSGNLFGTTAAGGTNDFGVVFEIASGTAQYSKLYDFCSQLGCTDGKAPDRVNLVIDTAGNLYGTTKTGGNSSGEGVVFELFRRDSRWHEKVLYSFCARHHCADGGFPESSLTYAGAAEGQSYDGVSPLYGTPSLGGANDGGTVYSLAPKSGTKKWAETVLYSFCSQANCVDGSYPDVSLFIDGSGNIYGTTPTGRQVSVAGTVFELSPNGSGYTQSVLYNFCSQANCTDGENPDGGVVMNNSGALVGITTIGGTNGDGVIFELSPNGPQWQFGVLSGFEGSNGAGPLGIIIDGNGNLFGSTYGGGTPQRKGTVFEFNGSIQTLYSFCPELGCPDGKQPVAGVVMDGAGNLFGAASQGGHLEGGTIYELSP